ncbi:MAG TPA: EAL domain-containing protein [Pyrinomonadaceae bacterium]|nr:EAL domain-containing protein [Pyrinomonadaceae bacterium]
MEQFLQQLLDRTVKNGRGADAQPISFIEIIGAFREFVEELPVMVYAVEPHPPYSPIYVSPAFKLLGYPLEEWCTNTEMWKRVIHPDDQVRVFSETDSSNETGKDVDYEYRIIAADGRVHWFHDRGCLIRDVNGNITHRQGVIFDITAQKLADQERRKAEADLGESETRYKALFENANDIVYIHDLKGNYLSINQAGERAFGYTRDEVRGLNISHVTTPEHLELFRAKLAEKAEGKAKQTIYEADCITKDGRTLTLEINSSVVYKEDKPVAIQGIARDVTERKQTEEALRRSEKEYRDLFENANDLIYTHDLNGNFTSLNCAGEKITGYSREEAVTMNIAEVVAPDFLSQAKQMIAQKIVNGSSTAYELEIIAKDGRRVSLELSTRLIFEDGKPIGVQGIGRDITARKDAEVSLHSAISLFASTFESTADGIIVVNHDREVVAYNQKLVELWEIPNAVMATRDAQQVAEFVAGQAKDPQQFATALEKLYSDPLMVSTDLIELKNGRVYERYSQPHFMEGKPVGRVCCFRDVTERELAEEKLRHYALHDTLTNLPNRVEFMNHLSRAIERRNADLNNNFAVLFLDLDRFKIINDSLGHVIGDKFLIAIAERLKACVRPGDVVARLGGDEFTVLLNRTGDINEVAGVAERLQGQLSEPFRINNYEVFTTASIGIIIADDMPRDPDDFLRDADTAMYRAKEAGKARYEIFDRDMHAHNLNVLQLETDLRHAVDRNEFEVFYQPIVDLDRGLIREFEALIRWRHPQHGLISPDTFIQVAEETGLIIPIGKWILEEACRQTAEWQMLTGIQLSTSVNLSAKQLVHPHLSPQIRNILQETQLNPRQLKLEVTESTVMENSERSLNVLNELSGLGVALSTDDFGTGYSSLSYLHRFPFTRLKIDRSFINKMDGDEKSAAIVKTILLLGKNLGIEVVAEGIETRYQLEILRSLGCRLGQGYIFSEPVEATLAGLMLHRSFSFSANPLIDLALPEAILQMQEVQ